MDVQEAAEPNGDRSPGSGCDDAPAWLARACIIIPALDAEATLGGVIHDLRRAIPERRDAIFVVDDGSTDRTAEIARDLGCVTVRSEGAEKHGKGAALRTGFAVAAARGMSVALSVDADGQHPAADARRVLLAPHPEDTLVLGVRDLVSAGAPRANRFSNAFSNWFLSRFTGRALHDTQCGLRRYPIGPTLALAARGDGYDFEAEVILRAVFQAVTLAEEPIAVLYPESRQTHFRLTRDPWRILRTIVATVGEHWLDVDRGARELR
jgi:glycosyltransferase involved in cell wall biosynthesis